MVANRNVQISVAIGVTKSHASMDRPGCPATREAILVGESAGSVVDEEHVETVVVAAEHVDITICVDVANRQCDRVSLVNRVVLIRGVASKRYGVAEGAVAVVEP